METLMKRSCSFLDGGVDKKAQGIIIQHRGLLYLLTCHHAIPSRKKSFGWHVYTEKKEIILDENNVGKGISCCGEDGIFGKFEHFRDDCPFDLDFVLLELNIIYDDDLAPAKFVDVSLSIEACIKLIEQVNGLTGFFEDGNASCFYMRMKNEKDQSQGNEVVKKEHYFSFPPLPTGSPKISVLRDWSFLMPYFKGVKDDDSDVCGGGASGAPMYAIHNIKKQPVLIGMHTSHRNDDEDEVPAIPDEFQVTKSFNTSFIWVLYLINLHVYFQKDSWFHGDFPLRQIAKNKSLLWAIFLRYQKKTLMLKEGSLLVKITQKIKRDLCRRDFELELEGEEKMFNEVERFLVNYEESAGSLVTKREGENTSPSQTTSIFLLPSSFPNLQSFATEMILEEGLGNETTSGYVSDIKNSDSVAYEEPVICEDSVIYEDLEESLVTGLEGLNQGRLYHSLYSRRKESLLCKLVKSWNSKMLNN